MLTWNMMEMKVNGMGINSLWPSELEDTSLREDEGLQGTWNMMEIKVNGMGTFISIMWPRPHERPSSSLIREVGSLHAHVGHNDVRSPSHLPSSHHVPRPHEDPIFLIREVSSAH